MKSRKCKQCKLPVPKDKRSKFCSSKCSWTFYNQNRILPPNAIYDCEVCGKHVEKYVSPCKLRDGLASNRFCSRTCAGKWRRKENHPMWNGGRCFDKDGYVLIHMPYHKDSTARGYILEHRVVMESYLGRRLKKREVVHHKNGDITDHKRHELEGVERETTGRFKKGVKHTGSG